MTIYNYPRPQQVYRIGNSVFLMCADVRPDVVEYNIPYYDIEGRLRVKTISHESLMNEIRNGTISECTKKGHFNDKPFYEIPLELQLTLL